MFGRVVSGFEHVQTIGHLPTGEKDRPLSPVIISHCGELELRKPPPKKVVSPEGSLSPPSRRRKERDGSEDGERDRKSRKEKRKKERKPKVETEEELDARCVAGVICPLCSNSRLLYSAKVLIRLEREEKERLEVVRLEKLAEMKRQLEYERQRIKESGGVVYKG